MEKLVSLCPICSNVSDFYVKKNEYNLNKCTKCGFIFVDPRPSMDELNHFYSTCYFDSHLNARRMLADKDAAQQRIVHINKLFTGESHIKRVLLDVGSGNSVFVSVACECGYNSSIVELNESMRESSINAISKWSCLGEVNSSFDVVTAWEYLEHVIDPYEELQLMYSLLKPGGVLAISMPNKESLSQTSFAGWDQCKPPEHINYFDSQSLYMVLQKIGFIPLSYRFIGLSIICSAWRRFGRSSNRTSFLWPLSSILWIILRFIWYSPFVKKRYPAALLYEGMEFYCVKL